jgi:uncharacterized membrane protein YbhN (UPF0104 family)
VNGSIAPGADTPGGGLGGSNPDNPRTRRWNLVWQGAKWVAGLVFVAFVVIAVQRQWPEVRDSLAHLPPVAVVASALAAGAAVVCSAFQQRSLLTALGVGPIAPIPWLGAFLPAQLGKYVPGSGLAYVAQMELSRRLGVRRAVSVTAMALGTIMTLLMAFVLGALAQGQGGLAEVPAWARIAVPVAATAGLAAITIRPGWVGAVLSRLPGKRFRGGFSGLELGHVGPSLAWSLAAWLAYGAHFWALAWPYVDQPGPALALALGGFPLAWAVGFLAIVVPAGVGVREMVLAAVLSPVTGPGAALTMAALSRFVILLAEVVLAAAGTAARWTRKGR